MEAKNDMGIDWAWMVPRPEAARERLEQLIGEQAEEVLARDRTGYEDFAHLPRPAMAPPGEEWVADELLRDALNVDWDNCRRVSFIGLCPLLPAEWRRSAYRSFLPDQLAAAVTTWSAHIDQVRSVGRRDYAYAWYRYARQRDIAQAWKDLLDHAERLLARGNRQAHPPALCPTWPIDFLHYPQYEEYVAARADQDWLQDGLGWLREAVGKGRGLYLWH